MYCFISALFGALMRMLVRMFMIANTGDIDNAGDTCNRCAFFQ